MQNFTVKVEGMACEKCTARIGSTLSKSPKISSVSCDLGAKTVSVTTSMPYEELKENIEDLGFDVID